jgi:hypothetical protein
MPIDYSVTSKVQLLVASGANEEMAEATLFTGDLANAIRFVMDLEFRHRTMATVHAEHDCGIGKVLLTTGDIEQIAQRDDFPPE